MAGGGAGMGAGGGDSGSEVFNKAGIDSTMADNFGARAPSYTPQQSSSNPYGGLMRPSTTSDYINSIYQQALGRTPDSEGAGYWANQAAQQGWTGQQLAENMNNVGAVERAQSGFQSQLNPSTYGQQALNRPSYYNTNPYTVDYANIFNPRAGQVVSAQPTLTPQQQSQYLNEWAGNYSQRNRAATQAANQQRIATANTQWENYLNKKAEAEAQEKIDAAVAAKEEEMRQQYAESQPQYYDYTFAGKKGGLATLKGFKR